MVTHCDYDWFNEYMIWLDWIELNWIGLDSVQNDLGNKQTESHRLPSRRCVFRQQENVVVCVCVGVGVDVDVAAEEHQPEK